MDHRGRWPWHDLHAWLFQRLVEPRVVKMVRQFSEEDRVSVVEHHWARYVKPIALGVLGIIICALTPFVTLQAGGVCLLVGLALLLTGGSIALERFVDRFVITNRRLFRMKGLLGEYRSMMPISRIQDVTMNKPFPGRIFGYGHFTFHSAATDQGTRKIAFVKDPDALDDAIQNVMRLSFPPLPAERPRLRAASVPPDP